MSPPKTYFYDNADEQARSLAGKISELLLQDIEASGAALLILPGGSSPRKLITLLAQTELPWDKIQITVTDERCVPADSEYSNIGQITRLFAERSVSINTISLLDGGIKSLNFPATVTILGMGLDGHIASLFPKQDHSCDDGFLIDALAPFAPIKRVSLSMEALLDTKYLILLVNGQDKWNICRKAMDNQAYGLPVGRLIHLAKEKLNIYVW